MPNNITDTQDEKQEETTNPGTTSAHAENTGGGLFPAGGFRNYLRARGEYGWFGHDHARGRELPPRTRRILAEPVTNPVNHGTTSACAENTRCPSSSSSSTGELPPHARRIPHA